MKQLFTGMVIFLFGCSPLTNMKSENQQNAGQNQTRFDVQGHRGCRGLQPENTWAAMRHALNLHVTTLEMDVVITKDNKVVLSHEPWFSQEITTKPDGSFIEEKEEKAYNLYRMNYAEILRYDVGLKPHPRFPKQHKIKATKPLLEDIIDSVNLYMTTARRTFPFFNIETKTSPAGDGLYHPAPPEFVERLMAVVQAKKLADYVIIQSFDFRTLQYLHQHYPAVRTAMLIEDYDKRTLQEQLTELGFTPSIYSPHYSLVTPKLLTACHRLGIKVIPWTVNEKQILDKLKEMGSDGVITDYPDLAF